MELPQPGGDQIPEEEAGRTDPDDRIRSALGGMADMQRQAASARNLDQLRGFEGRAAAWVRMAKRIYADPETRRLIAASVAIEQVQLLRRHGVDTTIFYRDIRTVSTGAEEMYRQARGEGVLFVRIPPGEKPEVVGETRAEAVRCYDELLDRRLEVPADLVGPARVNGHTNIVKMIIAVYHKQLRNGLPAPGAAHRHPRTSVR